MGPRLHYEGPEPSADSWSVRPVIRMPPIPCIKTSIRSTGSLGFRITGLRLHTKGVKFGTVIELSEPCLDMTNYGRLANCSQLIFNSDEVYPFTGQYSVEVLWRTLVPDQLQSSSSRHSGRFLSCLGQVSYSKRCEAGNPVWN